MPPSQLKRLKASLREQGITGPQKSKKQKKKGLSTETKIRRNVALESIRESFNPFEVKHLSRPSKHDITTPSTLNGKTANGALGRPGISKSLGEQKRQKTLLLEVQGRNKVGGIIDRRIGEDDPNMTAEEKALQRYSWERQRKKKKGNVFDLEDGDDDEDLLTHGGRTLDEDYDAASVDGGSDDEDMQQTRKRVREELEDLETRLDEEEPDRKKSRAEVMDEVVKKSKLYKFERQRAKEDDDDMRMELDKDLSDVRAALGAFQQALSKPKPVVEAVAEPEPPAMHPDRMALIEGSQSKEAPKSYDQQLRAMLQDGRAKPTDRIRSEEEIQAEAAAKAKELEDSRQKRMMGEDEESEDEAPVDEPENIFTQEEHDDAADFGFKSKVRHSRPEGIDDEDDFILEDDLIASESEPEEDEASVASDDASSVGSVDELMEEHREGLSNGFKGPMSCPRTLEEVMAVFDHIPYEDYHETMRSIRLRSDPSIHPTHKARLDDFAAALVEFLANLPSKSEPPSSEIFDVVIRHIHSMARKSAESISTAFRQQLRQMHATKSMTPGDLVILTAIGTIYPTSDHFHQIVTPAIILMARWLGLTTPSTPQTLTTGAYLGALCLKYQALSKRYIPELARFTLAALVKSTSTALLAPHIVNLLSFATLWQHKSALPELLTPFLKPLATLNQPKALQRINVLLAQAALGRRPLALHNHRPLAIKSAAPKFEESFDPTKHYDHDAARAETQKLKREFKKERKGAMRELRKDANFLARTKLKEKRDKDRAYDDKYRKLVAEIQGEEGHEAKQYEKERRLRRGKK
ncbi:Nop14-like protein [Microthyrium microscopicum]|uniref:Nop14-like protein n=1 Tax=Microthyrium microscopicum TaxID=703497 RepID=A0A6A6UT27_9PEZI|nr:Nop14-like protein [Microthyrium microscopicum]